MRFWLGTHCVNWLWTTDVDLFVSHRRLRRRKSPFPEATCDWGLDSGGFTELSMKGRWETTPAEYVDGVYRYVEELGRLAWAAPQDWMCEPWIVDNTGLTVEEHQHRTVESVLHLRQMAPDLPFIPVLQGWTRGGYERCLTLYETAGIDLTTEPVVGVGSVCRRQATGEIEALVVWLNSLGLNLHGFGVKTSGLGSYGWALTSADSMAWSYTARRDDPLPGCTHASCANCLTYALRWRQRVLRRLDTQQLSWAV